MKVLLTGGAGFVGSHIAIELVNSGYEVVVADDFRNSSAEITNKIDRIVKKEVAVYPIDVSDNNALQVVFEKEPIVAVIHLAGNKAVGESVSNPLKYYQNNLESAMTVLSIMEKFHVHIFIFSSSATVYGINGKCPFTETMQTGGINPYGWTKWMIEQMLMDLARSDIEFTPIILRYFNPIGAHSSGLIGETPKGIPNNLMPYIQQVAMGRLNKLHIFGSSYETKDGTGVRDFIHVMDLARGHVKALEYAQKHSGPEIFNLGTGRGYSVLDVINTFQQVTKRKIPYDFQPKRDGDLAECYADVSKAKQILNWTAEKKLEDMCRDAWNYVIKSDKGR